VMRVALGLSSLIYLATGTLLAILLVAHLNKHGIALHELAVVLAEAKHPSGVDLLFVVCVSVLLVLTLFVGILAGIAFVVLVKSRDRATPQG